MAIGLTLAGILVIVYFSAKLLTSVSEKESEIKVENQKLVDLFANISEVSTTILASSENLSVAIEEQTSSLQEVSDTSQSVSKDTSEMLAKSNKNNEILKSLLNENEVVASKTKDSGDKIEELMNVTDKNQKSLNDTLSIITEIKNSIEETFKSTKELEQKSKQVDEIRKLAEGTKQSLSQVGTIVGELKDKINIVEEEMKYNNEKSQVGSNLLNETVDELNSMISNLKLFSGNILEISEASDKVLISTKNAVQFNEEISNITENTISKYEMVTEEIAQSASVNEEIEASINELRNVAEGMHNLIE